MLCVEKMKKYWSKSFNFIYASISFTFALYTAAFCGESFLINWFLTGIRSFWISLWICHCKLKLICVRSIELLTSLGFQFWSTWGDDSRFLYIFCCVYVNFSSFVTFQSHWVFNQFSQVKDRQQNSSSNLALEQS